MALYVKGVCYSEEMPNDPVYRGLDISLGEAHQVSALLKETDLRLLEQAKFDQVVGRVTSVELNPENKQLVASILITDPEAIKAVKDGVYKGLVTGYSFERGMGPDVLIIHDFRVYLAPEPGGTKGDCVIQEMREADAEIQEQMQQMNLEQGRASRHAQVSAIRKDDKKRNLRQRRGLDEADTLSLQQIDPEKLTGWSHVVMFCAKRAEMDAEMMQNLQDALHNIRILSSCPVDEVAHRIVMSGVMHMARALVENPLYRDKESMMLDLAALITNVTYSTNGMRTETIVQCGCLHALAYLFNTTTIPSVLDQVMLAFVNILDDSDVYALMLLGGEGEMAGFLNRFLCDLFPIDALASIPELRLEHGGWVLRAICKHPHTVTLETATRFLPWAVRVVEMLMARGGESKLSHSNQITLNNLFLSLDELTTSHTELRLPLLQEAQVDRHMLRVLQDDEFAREAIPGAAEALVAYTNGEAAYTDAILAHGALPVMLERMAASFLESKRTVIALLWGISNILAGTHQQIQQALDLDVLGRVLALAAATGSSDALEEVGFCLANVACAGSEAQVDVLVKHPGAMGMMVRLLREQRHVQLRSRILDALDRILACGLDGSSENKYMSALEEAGVDAALEQISNGGGGRGDEWAKTAKLLQDYFDEEED